MKETVEQMSKLMDKIKKDVTKLEKKYFGVTNIRLRGSIRGLKTYAEELRKLTVALDKEYKEENTES